MRQIAGGLKVSTGTLYHYFPNKQALFEQLVEEICQQDIITALTEFGGKNNLSELNLSNITASCNKYIFDITSGFYISSFACVDSGNHPDKLYQLGLFLIVCILL